MEIFRQFADGSGLAGTVDPGQQNNKGLVPFDRQRPLQRRDQGGERLLQRELKFAALGQALLSYLPAQIFQQKPRSRHACVGAQQRGFQLLKQSGVDLAAAEQTADLYPCARQSGLESFTPGWNWCRFGGFFEETEHGGSRGRLKNR